MVFFLYQKESYLDYLLSDKPKILANLKESQKELENLPADQFSADNIKNIFSKIAAQSSNGEVYWPVRVALSGKAASLGPLEIADALGKEKTMERLALAIRKLGT